MIYEFAPAKLNLYLHITGRNDRGYHDLDSLVAFAGVGDDVRLEPADGFHFTIEGPQAAALRNEPTDNNLVVKAAKSLAEITGKQLNVALTLVKKLPTASGIGGGSSDAAAALRALAKHWGIAPDDPRLFEAAVQHGQDVPVCLRTESNTMTATGTIAAPVLPYADIVLVNPNKALPTADVYRAYKNSGHAFSPQTQITDAPENMAALVAALKARDNDLFEAACHLMPDILAVKDMLENSAGCLLARMSGSGATCFGIYADRNAARRAASDIMEIRPNWWVVQSYIPCRSDPRQRF